MKAGSIIALVVGCLLILPGVGLLLAGGGVGIAALAQGEDGYVDVELDQLESGGRAVTAEGLLLVVEPDSPDWLLRAFSVETRITVESVQGGAEPTPDPAPHQWTPPSDGPPVPDAPVRRDMVS